MSEGDRIDAIEEPPARQPTIYDVARVAGVSHQTVSRLLKGDQGIKPANRERVLQALETLDYRPNLTARSLATRRSHRVAVLTQELGQVGPGKVVQGAAEEARLHGFVLDIITLDVGDRSNVEQGIRTVNQQDVAGILALASTDGLRAAFDRADFRIPVLMGGEGDEATGGPPLQVSTVAIPELVDHLVALGHRDIVHIAGPKKWVAARNRAFAFSNALKHHGLRLTRTVYGDWSAASGYEAVRSLPARARFTAVCAANDQMALGAMLALQERGLGVPTDVSVTGIDDIPEAAYLVPPLTTVRMNSEEQGHVAFRNLLAQINGETPTPIMVEGRVILRKSTAPPALR
ncbi:LacI family DNA-binding transcriptional regulator [Humibacter sp. RRB41]|uniref:LacI family DNA-binding transcriptional regulator n=1 Tax=Humibacter sp. RRB41 TaxID=2919946 RepID=UPI001FA9C69A|nr:LacI family DNA-binding transcriptional regulator [Humibacter sp. RRB41]